MKAQLTHFVLSAALILTGLPLSGFSQGNKPDATINITNIKVRTQGAVRILEISWDVATQGNAAPQRFEVRADAKIIGGGKVIKTISLGGDARFTKLAISPAEANPQAGNAKLGGGGGNVVEQNKGQKVTTPALKELSAEELKGVTRAASLPGRSGTKTDKGGNGGGTIADQSGNASSPIKPAQPPAGGLSFVIESALVTVTGTFRGDNEAVNLAREFVPPVNSQGELKPRNGGGDADVILNKLIELKKSPRANQCADGRDCFELTTSGKGGNGFSVNLEVSYADGSRKTAVGVLPAPGRAVTLTVDNPKNLAFNSVRVSLRGQGDGVFTRKATREELLSF